MRGCCALSEDAMKIGLLSVAALALSVMGAAGQDQDTTVSSPGRDVSLPIVVKSVPASYTPEAMKANIEGWVMVEAVVLPEGTVRDVRVVRSLDTYVTTFTLPGFQAVKRESVDGKYGLDQQAVNSARQWVFKPGTKDGKAVAVRIQIKCAFTLGSKNSK